MLIGGESCFAPGGFGAKFTTLRAMAKTYRPTNDKKQLLPMISTIEQQSGEAPTELLADAGYCSDENLTAIADTWIDAYRPWCKLLKTAFPAADPHWRRWACTGPHRSGRGGSMHPRTRVAD
jgi:hypothetical protein